MVAENMIIDGAGTGDTLSALNVNSDIMKWAQIRADELAIAAESLTSRGQSPLSHDNAENGQPAWADDSLTKSPNYQWNDIGNGYMQGRNYGGPENLALQS